MPEVTVNSHVGDHFYEELARDLGVMYELGVRSFKVEWTCPGCEKRCACALPKQPDGSTGIHKSFQCASCNTVVATREHKFQLIGV